MARAPETTPRSRSVTHSEPRAARNENQGATAFSCPRCATCVEVTKYSREHTLTRWVDGHAACPELGDEPERFGTGRCDTLTAATRAAFDVGLIDAWERRAGT